MNAKWKVSAGAAAVVAAALLVVLPSEGAGKKAKRPKGPHAGEVHYYKARGDDAGAFRARSEKGAPEALKKGSKVWEGDHVITTGDTKMEIRLRDGSALRVGPDSQVILKTAKFDAKKKKREVSASLILGKVWTKVSNLFSGEDGEDFEVRTENAVAGVRGTTFRVNAMADASTVVRVYAGTVAVRGIRPVYQEHEPGKGGRKQVGKPGEVSKKQWERTVTKMMSVKIGANGVPEVGEFALADELSGDEAEWVAWNRELDGAE